MTLEYTYVVPAGNAATTLTTPVFGSLLRAGGGLFPATMSTIEVVNNTSAALDGESGNTLLLFSDTLGGVTKQLTYGMVPYGLWGTGSYNFQYLALMSGFLANVSAQLNFTAAPAAGGTVTLRARFWTGMHYSLPITTAGGGPTDNALYGASFNDSGGIMQALNPASGFGFIHHVPGAGNLETADMGGAVAYLAAGTTTVETSPTAIAKIANPSGGGGIGVQVYDSTTATGNEVFNGPVSPGGVERINVACATGMTVVTNGPLRLDYFITA